MVHFKYLIIKINIQIININLSPIKFYLKLLLNGLKTFINDTNNNKIKCLKSNCVLRIKNDFYDAGTKWKYANDSTYADIKMNIICCTINDTSDQEECMIVDTQFLLKFLLKATNMRHKLYSVIRHSDYLHSIANETCNIDNNCELYKNKILRIAENGDMNNLCKQSFWKLNIIVSNNENKIYGKMSRFFFKLFISF